MPTLRPDQVARLHATRVREIMVARVERYFPERTRALGRARTVDALEQNLAEAERLGYRSVRELAAYNDLAFWLGWRFFEDPQYPWTRDVAVTDHILSGWTRLSACYARTQSFLTAISGPDNGLLARALLRFRRLDFAAIMQRLEASDQGWVQLRRVLGEVWPEKCLEVGDQALLRVFVLARDEAASIGLTQSGGAMMWAALLFVFGVGCAQDRQIPWIGEYIATSRRNDEPIQLEVLHRQCIAYLDTTLRGGLRV